MNNQSIEVAMIDYIDLSCLCKDTPIFCNCKPYPSRLNEYGWQTYFLQGCKELQVQWRADAHLLRVRGSLPYFLKGHNFSFSREEYVEGIDLLQSLLGVGLWDASVDAFEYGCIVAVPYPPSQYVKNHTAIPKARLNENLRGKDKGAGKWWDNPAVILKMYDASKNIKMKQGLKAREVIAQEGYDSRADYLKFEAHFKKPFLINGGRNILAEDLQNPKWIDRLDNILIQQYKQLEPMKELVKPKDKKNYSALDVVVGEFAKALMNEGKPLSVAKRELYNAINQAECLSKPDKDARKATIKKAFEKLQEAEQSQWDITQLLEEKLQGLK